MKKLRQVFLLLACFFLVSACSSKQKEKTDRPVVYTSFFPIYDMTRSITEGTDIEVKSFMPPNQDPHMWEPTMRDLEDLNEADLLIVNGANLEPWIDTVRESLPDLEVLVLSDSVELITYKGATALGDFQYMVRLNLKKGETYEMEFGHTHVDSMRVALYHNKDGLEEKDLISHGKEIMEKRGEKIKQRSTIPVESGSVYDMQMGHQSGQMFFEVPEDGEYIFYSDRLSEPILSYLLLDPNGEELEKEVILEESTSQMDKITFDPHSWLSIKSAMTFLNSINMRLGAHYPEHKKTLNKNKVNWVGYLRQMEFDYKKKFDSLDMKNFVTTHYAYQYIARDFGLNQYPLQELTSMEDPSLNKIKKAIGYCQHYGVNTVFYETNGNSRGAETIAGEIGGYAVPLTSMEYVHSEMANMTYYEILEDNLDKLYRSMR